MAYRMRSRFFQFLFVPLLLLFAAISTAAQSVPEIEEAVISVGDLARTEDIYTSVMGFKVVDRGEGASPALQRLWDLPPGTTLKWVLLGKPAVPNNINIKLRVVQFTPIAERARYEYRDQDGGLMGLHLPVADVLTAYKALIAKGSTALHEPVEWAGGGGEMGVGLRTWYETFMHGPDGEEFIIVPYSMPSLNAKSASAATKDLPAFGSVRDIVFAVGNPDEAYAFYHGVLGWQEAGKRWEGFGPSMETMLRMPVGTVARPIFLVNPAAPSDQRLAIVDFAGTAKIDISARNAPPYRGLIMLSLRTPNVEQLYQEMVAANIRIVLPPLAIPDKPYGGAKAFSIRGPDGVFMEFVQRYGLRP